MSVTGITSGDTVMALDVKKVVVPSNDEVEVDFVVTAGDVDVVGSFIDIKDDIGVEEVWN